MARATTAKAVPAFGAVSLATARRDFNDLVTSLQEGRLPSPEARARFVNGVQRYLAERRAGIPTHLEVCFGLSAPGQHSWHRVEARSRRDALLRQLRREQFGHLSTIAAAEEVRRLVGRKSRITGAIVEETGERIPDLRQLRTILAAGDTALERSTS